MTTKAKKYTLSSPLSGEQIGNIDEMLDDLYKRVSFALSSTTAHMGAFGEGDLLYFDGTGVESITAAATGNALISGGLLTEPSWGKIGLTTHVSGTLPVGNGGTGSTAFTAGSVVFSNGTILTQDNANLFWDDTNNRLGIGTVSPARKVDVFIGADGGEGLRASNNTSPPFTHSAGLGVDNLGPLYGASIYVDGVARFSVNSNGGAVIGSTFLASFDGPANGLIVEGNVGIGTANPTKLLMLEDTGANASDNYAAMEIKTTGSSGFGPAIYLNGSSMTGGRHWLLNAAGTQDSAGVGKFSIYDVTGSADRLVINSSGNVGIGTTSPATALDVVGGISSTGRIITTSTSALGGITIDSAEAARFAIDRGSTAFVALFQFATAGSNKWFFGMDAATGDDFIVQNAALGTNLRISGLNVGIGDVTSPTSGDLVLIFGDGTAPSGMASNTAGLYANDVGGTVNMYAINEAGESTRLSWPAPQTYTVTNGTTDRSYNADSYTGDEIADVLATLIADLQARGILA